MRLIGELFFIMCAGAVFFAAVLDAKPGRWDWRKADRSSAGISPPPGEEPEPSPWICRPGPSAAGCFRCAFLDRREEKERFGLPGVYHLIDGG